MINKQQNVYTFMAFVLAFIDFTTGLDLFEGNVCQLHTGVAGICKNSQNCKWLIQNLQEEKMKFEDIRRCSFTVNEEIVCCGDDRPISTTPQNSSSCEFGHIFDNLNCSLNNSSGSKINATCSRYMAYAKKQSEGCSRCKRTTVINGEIASSTEFPHMVALGYSNNKDGYDFYCGASLIADRWLVTAAHCIKDNKKPVIARMGVVDLHKDDSFISTDRNITRIIRHPNYINSQKKNDIALIEFEGDVDFDHNIHPACIQTELNDVPEDVQLTIAGWGSIEADRTNLSKVLLKANLNIVPLDRCNETLTKFNELSNLPSLRALSKSQMCALNLMIRSDACQGDSGGPLFIHHPSGMSTIIGIISFGVSCGTALPGVYTRIASYVDWIENTIWPRSSV